MCDYYNLSISLCQSVLLFRVCRCTELIHDWCMCHDHFSGDDTISGAGSAPTNHSTTMLSCRRIISVRVVGLFLAPWPFKYTTRRPIHSIPFRVQGNAMQCNETTCSPAKPISTSSPRKKGVRGAHYMHIFAKSLCDCCCIIGDWWQRHQQWSHGSLWQMQVHTYMPLLI